MCTSKNIGVVSMVLSINKVVISIDINDTLYRAYSKQISGCPKSVQKYDYKTQENRIENKKCLL